MNIKKLRVMSGMTQTEFAKAIGVPLRTLRSWEQGQRKCKKWLYDLISYYLIKEGYV